MDNNNEAKQRNRRRKRAQRMQAIRDKQDNSKDDSGEEDESNRIKEKPQRPPCRRKKAKEPLVEEDIIDGFAILAFKTYEDLEVSGPLCDVAVLPNFNRFLFFYYFFDYGVRRSATGHGWPDDGRYSSKNPAVCNCFDTQLPTLISEMPFVKFALC